jgi:serine/threonine protein kinase
VRAYYVDEIAGRLYIAMEYIARDENGLNSLKDYLRRGPLDFVQSLRWAVQFCRGMEHAHERGLRCHRDVKPVNILIAQDGSLKITDFGLAGVLETAGRGARGTAEERDVGVASTWRTPRGVGLGTPTHMPPEQFVDASRCDVRSDIYSFGVVLYQLASGGAPPFAVGVSPGGSREALKRYWATIYHLHRQAPVPALESPLAPVVRRCLAKSPAERYQRFDELREALEDLLEYHTGARARAPGVQDLDAAELANKAASLCTLGRHDEAIACCDQAIGYDEGCASAWANRSTTLLTTGRYEEAIACCEKALACGGRVASVVYNKGRALAALARPNEALECFDTVIRRGARVLRHRDPPGPPQRGGLACPGRVPRRAAAIRRGVAVS